MTSRTRNTKVGRCSVVLRFSNHRRIFVGVTAFIIVNFLLLPLLLTAFGISSSTGNGSVGAAAPNGWNEPRILLPNVREAYPGLCVSPLNNNLSYAVGSGAWGVVTGNEARGWLTGNHLKLYDRLGARANCAYDPENTQHIVWTDERATTSEHFNVLYNRIVGPGSMVGVARNLTKELYGTTATDMQNALIAYSVPQKKVFLIYTTRGGFEDNPLFFVESANDGGTWSQPFRLGSQSGYRPAEPALVVDKKGNPHIFYGQFGVGDDGVESTISQILHRTRRADGSWSAPRNIVEGRGRPIATKAQVAPDSGDIYVTWTDGPADVARWVAATGEWKLSKNVTARDKTQHPTLTVASNGTLWFFWYDPDYATGGGILSRVSFDKGATWQPTRPVADLAQARVGRFHGMKAAATGGKVYVVFSADQLDPITWQGPTLFVTWVGENVAVPATPTSNPNGTLPPSPSPSVAATLTPGATATSVVPTTTVTPTPTSSPTLTPTVTPAGLRGDEYEPDSAVAEALSRNRYIQLARTETHTLYNPANPAGGYRDVDIAFFQAEAGKTYNLNVSATGFQPKVSLYRYVNGEGEFVTAANSCETDRSRICYNFTPTATGLYFAQFSSFGNEAGSPSLAYNLTLNLQAVTPAPPATVIISPLVTPTITVPVTGTATATLPPTNSPTASPTATSAPTATPSPTVAPTATPKPTVTPLPQPPANPGSGSAPGNSGTGTGTGAGNANNGGNDSTKKDEIKPTATVVPSPTLPPNLATATAYAAAQAEGAATPQVLLIPIPPSSTGGRGPALAEPTATPAPTQKATATATAQLPTITGTSSPTATATPPPSMVEASSPTPVKEPPAPGAIWLLPVGLALVGKGFLNLLGLKFRPY